MKVKDLIVKWRKEADQYQKQVEEARRAGTPHDQMLSAATFLRQCAKELEQAIAAQRYDPATLEARMKLMKPVGR